MVVKKVKTETVKMQKKKVVKKRVNTMMKVQKKKNF